MHLLKKIFLIISILFILIGCGESSYVPGKEYGNIIPVFKEAKLYEGKPILEFLNNSKFWIFDLQPCKAVTYPYLQYRSKNLYQTIDGVGDYYRVYILLDSTNEIIHEIFLIGNNYTIY